MANVFTQENFEKEVLQSLVPVLVDFWAPWCGPCKILSPILEELEKEYDGKGIHIGKVNVDENSALAAQFGVMSIPTLMFFKKGVVVDQMVGAQNKDRLAERIKKVIA